MVSDKLFVAGNSSYAGGHQWQSFGTGMSWVRRVCDSFFYKIRESGVLPITDVNMTRFMITLEQGVNLVWQAFNDMVGNLC